MWAAGIVGAQAQPLLQDPPLTTLLKPQHLDRSRPLLPEDRVAGSRPDARGGRDPLGCTRAASAAPDGAKKPAPTPGASMGGSGPGEYAQYVQGATTPGGGTGASGGATAAPKDKPSNGAAGGIGTDKPLYGGNDRPLWSTGDTRAARTPATRGATNDAPSNAAESAAPTALPRDKPLWASSDQPDPATPAPDSAGSDRGGSLALQRSLAGLPPCVPIDPGLLTR